jgi:hypothetical protein
LGSGLEKNIGRLDVAMQDPFFMRGFQAFGHSRRSLDKPV